MDEEGIIPALEQLNILLEESSINEKDVISRLKSIDLENVKSFDGVNYIYPIAKKFFNLKYDKAFLYLLEHSSKKFLQGFSNNSERYRNNKDIYNIIINNMSEIRRKAEETREENEEKMKNYRLRDELTDFILYGMKLKRTMTHKEEEELRSEIRDDVGEMDLKTVKDELLKKKLFFDNLKDDDEILGKIEDEHYKTLDKFREEKERINKKLIDKKKKRKEVEKIEENENDYIDKYYEERGKILNEIKIKVIMFKL